MAKTQPPPASLITNASPLATLVKRPRDVRDQKLPALTIVNHITGRATWNNAVRYKQDPLSRVEDLFTKDGMPFAHYCIDPWGTIAQLAYERERPWAQGLSRVQASQEPPEFWQKEWSRHGFNTVRELMESIHGGVYCSPNERSITIEHIQYGNGFKLTAAQYRMSHLLHMDIAVRHGMPMQEVLDWEYGDIVLGHEDVDPWSRGARGAGWDPGARRETPRFCWRCLLTLDFTHGGAFKRCPAVRATPEMPLWLKKHRKLPA